jgi:hypothetical protein
VKRLSIRILVALSLCVALAAFASTPIHRDENDSPVLPAVALEQAALYRLEVALAVFYGELLLITPVYSGLIGGRLPIEISARGAKFAEEADQSAELTRAAIGKLKQATDSLSEDLSVVTLEIERLDELLTADKTKRRVGSMP